MLIRKAAVLGAGTMGAQIAALLAGAGISTHLYDLAHPAPQRNLAGEKALAALKKLDPSPLFVPKVLDLIQLANYEDDLEALRSCDWVIEAVAEKLEIKQSLLSQLLPYLNPQVVISSNTSGLSIEALSQMLPIELRPRFMGVHFFNPPRYLPLVELIPHAQTDASVLDDMEVFLTQFLGKTVLRAKDRPNFIANRLGVFSILVTLQYAEIFQIPLEVVDALTGKVLGRPKSATLRTADLVGLDVLSHAVNTLKQGLPTDPWGHYFNLPGWIQDLISRGALGQKTQKGIYCKTAGQLKVFDLKLADYRLADQKPDSTVLEILKERDPKLRLHQLSQSSNPQGQFLWACFRELFLYAAYCAPEVAETVRDLDLAIRKGYGWKEGIFELWQRAGFKEVSLLIEADQQAGRGLTSERLPAWTQEFQPYQASGAFSPAIKQYLPRRALPVYARQLFPDSVLEERFDEGETLFENEGLRFWHQKDGVGIISFKTKLCTLSEQVLEGIVSSLKLAEVRRMPIVIWQRNSEHFSAGADLMQAAEKFLMEGPPALEAILTKFQQATSAVRYAAVPVVAAVRGYAFGGGCELIMHCDHVVACVESYIGLVEVGVGLIPGAGGCKELAFRASQSVDPEKALQAAYKKVAMAEVAKSAYSAQEFGYLKASDTVIANPDELLFIAKLQAQFLMAANYRPPLPQKFPVLGRPGIAAIRMFLVNLRAGDQISDYDQYIADHLAEVMCGGQVDAGSWVDEAWILKKERELFMQLVEQEKTFERIQHMLQTGKPLRN